MKFIPEYAKIMPFDYIPVVLNVNNIQRINDCVNILH